MILLLATSTVISTIPIGDAFVSPPPATTSRSSLLGRRHLLRVSHDLPRQDGGPLSMCICINCKFVTDCAAYHFVEERHAQPHMTEEPGFTPRDGSPTIHVNLRSALTYARNNNDNDEMKRLWREYKEEEESAAHNDGVGQKKYDMSNVGEVTYEYDVVKCADYQEDLGCWVRHMPAEIRLANPDFVPT